MLPAKAIYTTNRKEFNFLLKTFIKDTFDDDIGIMYLFYKNPTNGLMSSSQCNAHSQAQCRECPASQSVQSKTCFEYWESKATPFTPATSKPLSPVTAN